MVSKWQSWRFCVGLSSGRKERRIMGLEVRVQSDCSFYRAIAKSPRDSDNLVWRCEDAARGKISRRNFRRKDSPLRFSRTITSGPCCEQHEPSFFGSVIVAWEESLVVFVFRTAPDTNFARLDAVQETEESPRKESDSSAACPGELPYFLIGSKGRDTADPPFSLNIMYRKSLAGKCNFKATY